MTPSTQLMNSPPSSSNDMLQNPILLSQQQNFQSPHLQMPQLQQTLMQQSIISSLVQQQQFNANQMQFTPNQSSNYVNSPNTSIITSTPSNSNQVFNATAAFSYPEVYTQPIQPSQQQHQPPIQPPQNAEIMFAQGPSGQPVFLREPTVDFSKKVHSFHVDF